MATLPDLDTANISFIAYWNAIDSGGVGSINPEEALAEPNITSYTLYDNGFEGQYDLSGITVASTQTATVRIKQDGWIIAYFTPGESFVQSTRTNIPSGSYDLINDWTDESANADGQNHTLSLIIDNLASQLTNYPSMTYDIEDVGLYNYEYPTATTVTILSEKIGNNSGSTVGFTYTTGTTRHYHVITGSGVADWDNAGDYFSIYYNGNEVAYKENDNRRYVGTYDVLANSTAPNPNTEYQTILDTNSGKSGMACKSVCMVVWE